VSTQVFDPSRLAELHAQRVQRPWTKRPAKFNLAILVAVTLPALIVVAAFLYTDIPGTMILVAGCLPLQLLAAALAALATKGKRGILDSFIIVLALGATVFSFIILLSIILSLVIRGSKALSSAFLTQNDVLRRCEHSPGMARVGHARHRHLDDRPDRNADSRADRHRDCGLPSPMCIRSAVRALLRPGDVGCALRRGRSRPACRSWTVFVVTGVLEQSAFAGALAYSILMLPTVARTAEEVLRLIPDGLRTGALALGSSPSHHRAQGRATSRNRHHHRHHPWHHHIGETAPLLLTALKANKKAYSFNSPTSSLPSTSSTTSPCRIPMRSPAPGERPLVLMLLVLVLFTTARILGRNRIGR
jgi:phosphate transport system permease protein